MRETLQQYVINAVTHPASAASVAAGSVGSGASTLFGWLPPLAGFIATCCGIFLSIVLIRKHNADRELMVAEKALAYKEIELKEAQIIAITDRHEPR